jgi:hypothetical protein
MIRSVVKVNTGEVPSEKRMDPEEPEIDERSGKGSLPPHEHDAEGQAGQDRQDGQPGQAPLGDLLEAKITVSTAASDRAALRISGRPASGSRYSGRSLGPSTSSNAITGTASRNTAPHQKNSSTNPPNRGSIAAPTEKLVFHTLMAAVRCRGSRTMLRISDRVDGARVAPAMPSSGPRGDEHLGAGRDCGQHGCHAECGGPDHEQPAAADPVAQRPHRDQRSGDEESVDIDDP